MQTIMGSRCSKQMYGPDWSKATPWEGTPDSVVLILSYLDICAQICDMVAKLMLTWEENKNSLQPLALSRIDACISNFYLKNYLLPRSIYFFSFQIIWGEYCESWSGMHSYIEDSITDLHDKEIDRYIVYHASWVSLPCRKIPRKFKTIRSFSCIFNL